MVHTTSAECSPKALSVDEAARVLSISRRQVYYLLEQGALPSVLLGRRRLILVEDLDAFLEAKRVVRTEPAA